MSWRWRNRAYLVAAGCVAPPAIGAMIYGYSPYAVIPVASWIFFGVYVAYDMKYVFPEYISNKVQCFVDEKMRSKLLDMLDNVETIGNYVPESSKHISITKEVLDGLYFGCIGRLTPCEMGGVVSSLEDIAWRLKIDWEEPKNEQRAS